MRIWIVTNIRWTEGRPLAAHAIQYIRTAAALTDAGARVLVWAERLPRDPARAVERELGLKPSPELRFITARSRGKPGEKRTPFASRAACWWNLARGAARGGRPDAIVSRSPRALAQLEEARRRHAFFLRHARLVLEYQYPEWRLLWRGWRRRHPDARVRECVERLRALRMAEERWLHAADGVLYAARAHEHLLAKARWRGPAQWLPSASPPPESDPAAGPFEFAVGYVGGLGDENGVPILLEVLARLPISDRALLIVRGDESAQRRLLAELAQRGLADRAHVRTNVPHAEVRPSMRRCAVGVVPLSARGGEKRRFASPLKLVEWMAAGVPVVATDVPSVRQHVRAGVEALLAAPDDAQSLASAIGRLLADETLRRRLADEGLAYAHRHDYPARAKAMIEFVSSLPPWRSDRV